MSKTKVVGYDFNGTIDVDAAEKILARALTAGIITQYDSVKSAEAGHDRVWFNGHPGQALRVVRNAVAKLVVKR